MCGIFGTICKEAYEQKLDTAIPIMALIMESRGSHSYGISDGQEIIKDVGAISSGLTIDMFTGKRELIGHTRHATSGSQTKENAHPWKFGEGEDSIIGIHNGIISNEDELNRDHDRKFAVDSQHIFQHILENKPLREIRGYGAIAFFQRGKIYLGRFNNGNLAIARTKFGIVFASTQEAVSKAMKMSGLEVECFYAVEDERMYVIEDGLLFNCDRDFKFGSRYEPLGHHGGYYDNRSAWTGGARGRWINNKWEEGKWINNDTFIPGQWTQGVFHPSVDGKAQLLMLGDGKSKKGKKKTKKNKDVDSDACALCQCLFSIDEETWDSPFGEMCDSCMMTCFRSDTEDESEIIDLDKTIENSVGEGLHKIDDPFSSTTVRAFLESLSKDEAKDNRSDKDTVMSTCDECSTTVLADEKIFIDKIAEGKVKWILCESCHHSLTTPYNTNFPVC